MFALFSSPKSGFNKFKLAPPLLKGIAHAGFKEPRPIQAQTLPAALEGRDVLGLAQTGTGKTAGFALPILERIVRSEPTHPTALILAPTRELAAQITKEFQTLSHFTDVKTLSIYGGVNQRPQVAGLRNRPDVLVACPGRLLDLIQQGHARLDTIETLVLDEADHMFDMGFLVTIRKILKYLPNERQNLLFSATMPAAIRRLADEMLHKPHVVELAHQKVQPLIDQVLYPVHRKHKLKLLEHLFATDNMTRAIVFTRTKRGAKTLAQKLERSGHQAVALQGNMSQNARERVMGGFRSGAHQILVATDIAARGIDVPGISHVINYDAPTTAEAYTHRIGRTGRAEQNGKSCTFITDEDRGLVRDLERRSKNSISQITLDEFNQYDGDDDPRPSSPRGNGPRRNTGGRRSSGSSERSSSPKRTNRSPRQDRTSEDGPRNGPRSDSPRDGTENSSSPSQKKRPNHRKRRGAPPSRSGNRNDTTER